MNEREIERLAEQLGARRASRVDPERVAHRVVARLRTEGLRARPTWARSPLARAAATIALVAGVAFFALRNGTENGSRENESLAASVQGLESLSGTELAEVLDSLTVFVPVHSIATAGLDDLTDAQLRELLASLEG